MTGVFNGSLKEQLMAFTDSMEDFGYAMDEKPKDWMTAFKLLKNALKARVESGTPCTIFLDELPAMDAQKSGIAKAVGYFWNQWASRYSNITLIVCGSATSIKRSPTSPVLLISVPGTITAVIHKLGKNPCGYTPNIKSPATVGCLSAKNPSKYI